ncbi:uncharacterized protein AMSG_11370 [Thecamonas trahens ATCC 50062]|uniref:Uncharacterized protein n=1 Tax=Thecamonas trahens ATCC 50062 TaxID=461836 RepID=A0A0L0DU99_THETB|nr:hypothetical protein AMSG_11370 [Thecamonas trahens ATCC 50062]KNC55904.1 hypothetical protein AMSG_11370 [Thecamonas trahens ATCC 50062]|eukprot:XP_013752723.1 hypothetical protein AMSG_11370 [Thecamonas trahens ATCC 50062]
MSSNDGFSSFLARARYQLCVYGRSPECIGGHTGDDGDDAAGHVDAAHTAAPQSADRHSPDERLGGRTEVYYGEVVDVALIVHTDDRTDFARSFFSAAHIGLSLTPAEPASSATPASPVNATSDDDGWMPLDPLPSFGADVAQEPAFWFGEYDDEFGDAAIVVTMRVPIRSLPASRKLSLVCTVTPPLLVETSRESLLSSVPFAAEPDAASVALELDVICPLVAAARCVPLAASHAISVSLTNTAAVPVGLDRASFMLAGSSSVRDLAVRDGFHLEVEGLSHLPCTLSPGEVFTMVYVATPKSPLRRSDAAFFADLRLAWSVAGMAASGVTSMYRIPWRTPLSGDLIVQTSLPPSITVARVFPVSIQVTNATDMVKSVKLLLPAARSLVLTAGGLGAVSPPLASSQASIETFLAARLRTDVANIPVWLSPSTDPESDDSRAALAALADEYHASHPADSALLCLEQSVVLGDIPPKATIAVNVYACALTDGFFELAAIRLYDETASQYYVVAHPTTVFVAPLGSTATISY